MNEDKEEFQTNELKESAKSKLSSSSNKSLSSDKNADQNNLHEVKNDEKEVKSKTVEIEILAKESSAFSTNNGSTIYLQ